MLAEVLKLHIWNLNLRVCYNSEKPDRSYMSPAKSYQDYVFFQFIEI